MGVNSGASILKVETEVEEANVEDGTKAGLSGLRPAFLKHLKSRFWRGQLAWCQGRIIIIASLKSHNL